jgi:uncharacterized protein (DUF2126 family)/transglutaminase-like putative cysteine protease
MAIRVALNHATSYRYDRLVELSPHVVRLRPAVHTRTPIEAYSLRIRPEGHFINWQQDPFGNYLARLVFPEPADELSLEVDIVAEMTVINPFDFFIEEHAEFFPFEYEPALRKELVPYLEIAEDGPRLQRWLKDYKRERCRTTDFLVGINQALQHDIGYRVRLDPGVQSCEETLDKAIGSCRDSGWLLVQLLRHLGLAARFVSGYLVQLTPDVKSLDGPSGPEHDFTDLHAWAEVYVPGAGWLGLDPTSGLFAGEGHIPLACTPDPASAAPLTGSTDPCEVTFHHCNTVTRIHEDPRVTKPYRDDQWSAILALGRKVDEDLNDQDVRLTMGGEPTFVSVDDMDSPEWKTAALGKNKRLLAGNLLRRLARRFAPGAALHCGEGKWYPGEPLPRWALGCFWRKDGMPIWRRAEWLSLEGKDHGHGIKEAHQFATALTRRLGVDPTYILPGYEDALYQLFREGTVPVDVDLFKANLRDSDERASLAAVLSRGLDIPVGYALPLRWDDGGEGWQSSSWTFRRERLFLIPGDSPMGLRLPLDSLPKAADEEREAPQERNLFETPPPLGDFHRKVIERYEAHASEGTSETTSPSKGLGSTGRGRSTVDQEPVPMARTALCVEARGGCLHLFLPPTEYLEQYLDLVASIEETAADLKWPVVLEGYDPPRDLRLLRLLVTPDPGVIEVNIHPAHSWEELVANTTALYEEGHGARLGTEKFMLDGRHTGTGGGNHVTLGGPTPADSPMLRRPDLLASLVNYWQHHPGLSYLFSGMFIGPISQAPRVDEARDEMLYELEIAFQQLPKDGASLPWLTDRLLRHLLVDLTGNTHRAEFCIDKLYSPDSERGRLGLVEFRAFEMPPHSRMSLVQMLLLRALVARFWRTPYSKRMVRWGTELHDRFMLPHYVWADLREVLEELNACGTPFQAEWLAPFHEFRFPLYGSVTIRDIRMELRMALEPWPVLGEEVTAIGTARFVDSSVERLEVKVSGLTDGRYVVACNGRRVPLHGTGTHGEYVAGVRYRAWQPPSALHPTIGVHSPLIFDIIDTWNGRSVGGCTYHVGHPGGRAYDVFPVNAFEAEARRISRFWGYGHTPGSLAPPADLASLGRFFPEGCPAIPMAPPAEEFNREYPYTLDLRRAPDV